MSFQRSLCVLGLLFATAAMGGSSQLYGIRGESWDPLGRLPDFSYAGYSGQGDPLPKVDVVADVTEYGAVGDGITDDTQAFQQAIAAMGEGALLIPTGDYRLTEPLYIEKSHVVLRGASREGTRLLFENALADVYGDNQVWSWNGGFIWARPQQSPQALTVVLAEAERGDRTLQVADSEGLIAGQLVVLSLRDEGGTLGRAMHNDLADSGDCTWQVPLSHDWPVRIQEVGEGWVTLEQPLRLPVLLEWQPTLKTAPFLSHVGIEELTVEFPSTEYPGHLNERGYNAVFFEGGVVDSWVQKVNIVNADNGVLFDRLSKHLTVDDLHLSGRIGHHGLNIAFTADALFSDIYWDADFIHDFTFDHRSSGNVVERARSNGLRLSLDHHRDGSHENLFTDFDVETDFWSGGSQCAGPGAGARQTFWNMASGFLGPPWARIQANIVGDIGNEPSLTEQEEWFEPVDALQPANLYREQLAQRIGLPSTVSEPPVEEPDEVHCGCRSTRESTWLWGLMVFMLWPIRRTSSFKGWNKCRY